MDNLPGAGLGSSRVSIPDRFRRRTGGCTQTEVEDINRIYHITIDVREIFCQGCQNPILRPNEILDRIFKFVFVLFLKPFIITCLKIKLFMDSCKGNSQFFCRFTGRFQAKMLNFQPSYY